MRLLELDLDRIIVHAGRQFGPGKHSVHGLEHWRRTFDNGSSIASTSDADMIVVTLFAFLHDSCRLNDSDDLEHGQRAAELVKQMQGEFFALPPHQLQCLVDACRMHTDGKCSDDPTIGTCWDADRLDLARVGIVPDPQYFSTNSGKELANKMQQTEALLGLIAQ